VKLLMIYADKFAYKTSKRTLEIVEEYEEEKQIEDVLVGFIQVEKEDEEKIDKVETKLIKNLKWAAKKNDTKNIILHSFAHEKRLENAGYKTWQTPFGYFLDLDLKAPGKSLARVFKEF